MKSYMVKFLVGLMLLMQVGCAGINFNTNQTDMIGLGLEIAHIEMLDRGTYTPEEALAFSQQLRAMISASEEMTPDQLINILVAKMDGPKGAAMLTVVKRRMGSLDWDMNLPMDNLQLDMVIQELDTIDEISMLFQM
jgi:hypothetical protein